jgi:type I restriction enzyme S subunit
MEKQNIPALRFPEFDKVWEKIKLGKHIDLISGFPFKSELFGENGKKLVIPKNFTKFGFGNFTDSFTKRTTEEVDEKYLCSENDLLVLLTDLTSTCELLGKPLYLTSEDGDVLLNQRIIKIIPNEKILLKRWLLGFLLTENYHKRIKETSSGSTVRHSSNKIINNIDLVFPSLPEQQKTASFLTEVDNKLQGLKRKAALLEQYKKGMMQKLFSQALRFKDENGQPYPNWEKKKLGEVFTEINEKVGSKDIETYSISAGIGFVSQREKFGKNISGDQNPNYIVLEQGDFSYNKGNSKTYKYGCVYLNLEQKSIAVPNVFISFRLSSPTMNPNFFAKLFESHYLDRSLRKIISSSARMDGLLNVNKTFFFGLKIPVPCDLEQTKIANFLTAIDQKIEQVGQQIAKAERWKKGLLQKMFV